MKKFDLNGYNAYVIIEDKNGFYINDCNGFLMEAEQMKKLANGLINFANKYEKELRCYNIKREVEFNKELKEWTKSRKEPNYSGYVYFLECGGKYKIGYSKNVEKRIRELDYRPFKINLIIKSKNVLNAYKIEQNLHIKYEKYKIIGEWYSFDEEQVEEIKKYLYYLGEN